MTVGQAAERFKNDAEFYCLVTMFYRLFYENKFTIGELKDALLFAGIKFEQENIKPIVLGRNGEMEFLRSLV